MRTAACRICGSHERNRFDQCFPCKRLANAKHRAKTRKDAVARTKRWQMEHPEQRKQQAALYRSRHLDQVKASVRKATAAWRKKHPDKVKADNAKWYADHPQAIRVKNSKRYGRTKGTLSKDVIQKLWTLQQGKCIVCRRALSETGYHLDHILA